MDVGLTSEQLSLRDTVRDILRTECPPDAARQAMSDPERWRTLWKTVVDLGWTELATPETCRVGDYGPIELAVVLEECGAAIPGTDGTPTATRRCPRSVHRPPSRDDPQAPATRACRS